MHFWFEMDEKHREAIEEAQKSKRKNNSSESTIPKITLSDSEAEVIPSDEITQENITENEILQKKIENYSSTSRDL